MNTDNLIDKMQSEYDNKLKKKKEIYNKILVRIENLMKESAKNGKDMCMYSIPEIIFGLPIYNLKECMIYIKQTLTKKSFKCVICEPNMIFIFWKLKNKIENENNYKMIENKSPQTIMNNMYTSNNIIQTNSQQNNSHKSIKQMKVPQTFFFNH